MKNRMWILLCFALALFVCSSCSIIDKQDAQTESNGFCWKREEGRLIDYTISEDTIQFRYEVSFENNSEDDIILSCLTASFPRSQLRGWLRYEKYYDGVLESGDFSVTIKAGEKATVIYVFSGEYLGGPVPEKLSISSIVMLQD